MSDAQGQAIPRHVPTVHAPEPGPGEGQLYHATCSCADGWRSLDSRHEQSWVNEWWKHVATVEGIRAADLAGTLRRIAESELSNGWAKATAEGGLDAAER